MSHRPALTNPWLRYGLESGYSVASLLLVSPHDCVHGVRHWTVRCSSVSPSVHGYLRRWNPRECSALGSWLSGTGRQDAPLSLGLGMFVLVCVCELEERKRPHWISIAVWAQELPAVPHRPAFGNPWTRHVLKGGSSLVSPPLVLPHASVHAARHWTASCKC